jgi:hypothetical protein
MLPKEKLLRLLEALVPLNDDTELLDLYQSQLDQSEKYLQHQDFLRLIADMRRREELGGTPNL